MTLFFSHSTTQNCARIIHPSWTRSPYRKGAMAAHNLQERTALGVDLGMTLGVKTTPTKFKFQNCKYFLTFKDFVYNRLMLLHVK